MTARLAGLSALAFCLMAIAGPASAQQYPSRTVAIITPYPAGVRPTKTARWSRNSFRQGSSKASSSTISAAANTIVACEKVARAAPDGYTLLLPNFAVVGECDAVQ